MDKTDVFIVTGIQLFESQEEFISESSMVFYRDNIPFKANSGAAKAYCLAKNSFNVVLCGDQESVQYLSSLDNVSDNIVGIVGTSVVEDGWAKNVKEFLEKKFGNDYIPHLIYSNGFGLCVKNAEFSYLLDIHENELGDAAHSYITPFITFLKTFEKELSFGMSYLNIRTSLAGQRVMPLMGIDPILKHGMTAAIRLAVADLTISGINITQLKEGATDTGFYDGPVNLANSFLNEYMSNGGESFFVKKQESLRQRDDETLKIVLNLLDRYYDNNETSLVKLKKEAIKEHISTCFDGYSIVNPMVNPRDLAEVVIQSIAIFLNTRHTGPNAVHIPELTVLPQGQVRQLGF